MQGESYVEPDGITASEGRVEALGASAAEVEEFIGRHRFRFAGIGLVGMSPRSTVDSLNDLEQYVFGDASPRRPTRRGSSRPVALMDAEVATALVCIECKTVSHGTARGWRVFLTDDEPAETEGPLLR